MSGPASSDLWGGSTPRDAPLLVRAALALLLVLLAGAGVWDLGLRREAMFVGVATCALEEESCFGRLAHLGFSSVRRVAEGAVFLTTGRREVKVLGWPGPFPKEGVPVSMVGRWLDRSTLEAVTVEVHPWRRLKSGVGALILLGWAGQMFGRIRRTTWQTS